MSHDGPITAGELLACLANFPADAPVYDEGGFPFGGAIYDGKSVLVARHHALAALLERYPTIEESETKRKERRPPREDPMSGPLPDAGDLVARALFVAGEREELSTDDVLELTGHTDLRMRRRLRFAIAAYCVTHMGELTEAGWFLGAKSGTANGLRIQRCCGVGYVCSPYPSVIRRFETGVPEQPVIYEWVTPIEGVPYGTSALALDVWQGEAGWAIYSHPDDESPESVEGEAEGLDELWKQGPPLHWRMP